ncbi:MAG: hypothetical protein ABEJ74_01660 [Haloferacaceae archaeon]
MVAEDLQGLTEFCKTKAGTALRSVFTYSEEGGEVLYARDDVGSTYQDGGFQDLFDVAWDVHTTVLDREPEVQTLGEYRVTVHTFDSGFVMQFREAPGRGVAVAFDRSIGRNLHEFLLECESFLS